LTAGNEAVALPSRGATSANEPTADTAQSEVSTVAAPSQLPSTQETPATSQAPSEADVNTTAPSSAAVEVSKPATPQSQAKKDPRPAVPIVPAVPAARPKTETAPAPASAADSTAPAADSAVAQPEESTEAKSTEPATPAPKAAPKSWADLMRSKNSAAAAAASAAAVNGAAPTNGATPSRASTLAGALKQFNVDDNDKIAFLEPRGLVNTGNMCYMNSVCCSDHHSIDVATDVFRFSKYLCTVCPFTTFWIRLARELLIRSRVRLLWLMPCKFCWVDMRKHY
jgi:ubiquitin carboxyl-terminal hydrolase 10